MIISRKFPKDMRRIDFDKRIRRRERLAKGVFVVPSLVTALALFLGFYAIIFTLQGLRTGSTQFEAAAFALIFAGVLDNLDGRIARLMKVESAFGVQFDSIADMVSFGIAPAVIAYGFGLIHLDRLGWMGAFLFLACAGIRLARFNVINQSEPASKKYFKGMSSPVAAGGLVMSMIQMQRALDPQMFPYGVLAVTIFLAFLMVSNVRFRTFKDMDFKKHPMQYFLFIIIGMASIFAFREDALFVLFLMYLTFGLGEELVLFRRRRKSDPNVPFLPFGDRD